MLDHGFIANPKDNMYLSACSVEKSKVWIMSLNGYGEYCNPTVENLAKEIFLAMECLFSNYKDLQISQITLYETPNCYTICTTDSVDEQERFNWLKVSGVNVQLYAREKGIMNYDDRK